MKFFEYLASQPIITAILIGSTVLCAAFLIVMLVKRKK